MKRKIEHPPAPTTGRRYWRSLNEYADKPEFKVWLEKEFPGGAPHEVEMDGMSRRHFLRVMGASMALAGLGMAGCRRPEAYFVPYTKSPEWLVPGETLQYATAMPTRWGSMPLLATCVDGRPIKIEPNKDNEWMGGTNAYAQASILDLYDPYRARFYKKGMPGEEMAPNPRGDAGGYEKVDLDWGDLVEPDVFYKDFDDLCKRSSASGGKGLAFLSDVSTSPTRERLVKELGKKYPQSTWATYEPIDNTAELEATEAVFGQQLNVLPLFAEADVILSFENDFLGDEGDGGPHASKGFAAGRRRADEPGETMNRLYVIESRFTTTGGAADHRLRLPSSHTGAAVVAFAMALKKLGVGNLDGLINAVGADAQKAIALAKDEWIVECAKDLMKHPGKSLLVAGTQQSPAVQALVLGLNDALGAINKTLRLLEAIQPQAASIADLAQRMDAGDVETLVIIGGNPAYNAPATLNWAEKQKKVRKVIRLGYYEDETTELSHWHIPMAHYLESWGDGRARDGSYVASQPMVLPLFNGISEIDLLGMFLGMVQYPAAASADTEPTRAPGAASLAAAAGGDNAAAKAADGQPETQAAISAAVVTAAGEQDTSPITPADRLAQDEELIEVNSWYLVKQTFLKTEDAKLAKQLASKAKDTTGSVEENAWMMLLHDGFVPTIRLLKQVKSTFNAGAVSGLIARYPITVPELSWNNLELTLFSDPCIDDGRYVNNGWLQECPEPMTTLTWDNALLVSPATADKWVEEGIISHSTLTDGGSFGDAIGLEGKKTFVTGEPNSETRVYNDGTLLEPYAHPNFPMVKLDVGGYEMEVPVLVTPGQTDNSVALALGYGRRRVGPVGYGAGFDVYAVRSGVNTHAITGVKVAPSDQGNYLLALTQEHSSMQGRGLVREAPLAITEEHPDWINAIGISSHTPGFPEFKPIYPNPYAQGSKLESPMQWGMAIDLNTCTGCNACVIACQSENNIPIVGKRQVSYGREMSWIRMDRYYSGDINDPQLLVQPVACMQCEQAPCETVCPVNATIHSNEGLNVMAYNRCIGTRYCANNCPYKVRRFNYFEYNERPIGDVATSFPLNAVWPKLDQLYYGPLNKKGMPDTLQMSKNPNVTVRMRGVMEKCTYCVQRIEEAKIAQLRKAKNSPDTMVPDGAIRTACQEACPSESIAFGNIRDKNSQVSKWKANARNYAMLDYTGVGPRTTYLGRVRNPNPAMPGAELVGMTSEMHFKHGDGHDDAHGGHDDGHGKPHKKPHHKPGAHDGHDHKPKKPHGPGGKKPHPAKADHNGGGH